MGLSSKSLRRKLGRLPEPAAPSAGDVLAELRRRMKELTGGPAVDDSASCKPCSDLSPTVLDRRANAEGPYWGQRMQVAQGVKVGHVALRQARSPDTEILSLLAIQPALAEIDFSKALYLDTETTGLGGGAGTYAFLVGVAFYQPSGELVFEQFMLAGPEQERALLVELEAHLRRASVVISFNGKSYDMPLIEGRYVLNRMEVPKRPAQLDLLHMCRRIHKARQLRCSLKNIEANVLGFERQGDIDGAEVAQRYLHYLRTQDAVPLGTVIEHNRWDVLSMVALVALYGSSQSMDGTDEHGVLRPEDWIGVAQTLKRSKALGRASRVVSHAVSAGAGAVASRVQGEIYKALGQRLQALRSFESAEAQAQDPAVRLELAKLYEHFQREPALALEQTLLGTGESEAAQAKRASRLRRKIARADGTRKIC